ncbi:MAG: FGGY-family carbohydrate kinase [Hyphomicrobiales bacterium]
MPFLKPLPWKNAYSPVVWKRPGPSIEEIVLLGGGARSELWCQIVANVLGRPVKLAREQESTALGRAFMRRLRRLGFSATCAVPQM